MTISRSDTGPIPLGAFPISPAATASLIGAKAAELLALPELEDLDATRAVAGDGGATPGAANDNAGRAAAPRPVGGLPKRSVDVVVAVTALVLISPVMLLIAVLIWAQGGPVLFVHRRVGFEGRPFGCYKFRTMCADPEAALSAYLASHPDAQAEWLATRKLRRDPRVTLLGRILRRASLDELPQLFNVVRGEMSCVGPRPVVADELERYGEVAGDYLRTRPGLTGLWQVNGRNAVDYARRVELDGQYVRTWRMRNDLVILLRTVFAVVRFDETC